jgi:hypothetical protein
MLVFHTCGAALGKCLATDVAKRNESKAIPLTPSSNKRWRRADDVVLPKNPCTQTLKLINIRLI